MTMSGNISRREAIGFGLGIAGTAMLSGCLDPVALPDHIHELRLTAQPGTPTGTFTPGLHTLQVKAGREALLYVPTSYVSTTPAPIALMLHGGGGDAQQPIDTFQARADQRGLCMVSVKSLGFTWDGMNDRFTDDIPIFDEAMKIAFANLNIDASLVGIEGFSDGATYAVAIGRANGDLFKRVSAQSMGMLLHTTGVQKPVFYITHGAQDEVLPATSAETTANQLKQVYTVTFETYTGGHAIPATIATKVVDFLSTP
jgi:phospholipase/carboxylesterase